MITRVGIPKNFIENKLWWGGREFLKLKKEQMFVFSIPESNFDTGVRKTSSTCLSLNAEKFTCNMNDIINFSRYSNYDKVLRITAWIHRFICNLRRVKTQETINESIFKLNELKEAEKLLVKANQFEFHLTDLSDNNSKFRSLNVKLDEEGILRCEGRLKFAPIPQETRSPILLNDNHPLSKLIILNIHESNKHSSAKYTLNEYRQKFWLLCGSRIVRNIIRACCKRH